MVPGGDGAKETAIAYAETRAARVSSIVALVIAVSYSTYAFLFMQLQIPRFMKWFADFNATLPMITRVVASPFFVYSLPVVIVAAVIKGFVVKNRLVTLVLNGIVILIAMTEVALLHAGLFAPMMSAMSAIGEP